MSFQIPNLLDAAFPEQAEVDSGDVAVLVAALAGVHVISGCAVTAQGSPNMTVAVASGVVRIGGAAIAVSAGNVTITAANGTNPRQDLIVVDGSGNKSAIAGTPASTNALVWPSFDHDNEVVLAVVYVPANDTDIDANQIVDKRVIGGSSTPGGSDTQVQINDSGAFGGDSGLTYNKTTDTLSVEAVVVGAIGGAAAVVPLTVQGSDGQTADLVRMRTGATLAFYDTLTHGEELFPGDLKFTARTGGAAGNSITVEFVNSVGNNQPLAVSVVGDVITVSFATDGSGNPASTTAQIIAAIQASVPANALIAVALTGSDDTQIVTVEDTWTLERGADAADVFVLDAYGSITKPIEFRPVAGQPVMTLFPLDTSNLLRVYDTLGLLRVAVSRDGLNVNDTAGDPAVIINYDGIATLSTLISKTAGPQINPTDSGSDGLVIDAENLVPADGAAMIRFIRPIGNMPDAFYANDDATINMTLENDAAVLLIRGQTVGTGAGGSDGELVGLDLPLSPGHHLGTRKSSAPADADLVAGDLKFWFDKTNGAAKAMFFGKQADGTVVTGSVALT